MDAKWYVAETPYNGIILIYNEIGPAFYARATQSSYIPLGDCIKLTVDDMRRRWIRKRVCVC